MDYEKALEKARSAYGTGAYDDATLEFIFPQIKENEEEKRVKAIEVLEQQRHFWSYDGPADKTPPAARRKDLVEAIDVALSYLEKQKEQEHICDSAQYEEGFKTGLEIGLRKQKEQKPAEWSEEDGDILRDAICATDILAKDFKKDNPHLAKILIEAKEWLESLPERFTLAIKQEWDEFDEDCLERAIWYVENPAPSVVKDTYLALWLKSIPERFNLPPKQEQNDYITPHKEFFKFIYDRLINVHKENPNVDYMRSFKERINNLSFGEKQDWSEKHIADVFEKVGLAKIAREQGNDELTNALQDAMLELSKVENTEWSEEDEEMLNSCISSIEESKENRYAYKENDGDTSYDREIAWLKSLRNRPKSSDNWKPSEAQLMALHSIIDEESDTIGNEQLKLLYNDLKKL